jgi:hypothetical protein
LIGILQSCKKQDFIPLEKEDLGLLSLGGASDFLDFKPGSYWIYRYSETGELDTVVRQRITIDTFHSESSKRKFDYETIHYVDASFPSGYSYDCYSQSLNAEVLNFEWGVKMIYEKFNRNSYEGIVTSFYYPFVIDRELGSGSGRCIYKGTDTMTVSGKHYTEVHRFYLENNEQWYIESTLRPNTSYYWAKGYGLIKKEVHDNRIPDYGRWE